MSSFVCVSVFFYIPLQDNATLIMFLLSEAVISDLVYY